MHRAVDPSQARRIVQTAEEQDCPHCGGGLVISQHRDRYVQRLDGLVYQLCRDKRCPQRECEGRAVIYRPMVDLRLALPRMSFGLDVVMAVGEQHLERAQSLSQIGRDLSAKGVPIHQTHVGELLRSFLALCQMARGDEEQVRQRLLKQGGIHLMVDGVQLDDRSPVLYLCWDAKLGEPLFGERLQSRDTATLRRMFRRVKRLGVPVLGVTTDAEKGLVPAVAEEFPGVPHQLCHTHFLKNCARPMEQDLQKLGASVEQRAERVRKLARRLDKDASALVGTSPPKEPEVTEREVAQALCELVKPQAKSSGKAPLAPPELARHERLEDVRQAVELATKKKTLPATPFPPPTSMSSPRLCRWTGIKPGLPAVSRDRSRSFAR